MSEKISLDSSDSRYILFGVGYCLFNARVFQNLLLDKRTTPHFLFAYNPPQQELIR